MRRPVYLPDTASLRIGYNHLTDWTSGVIFFNSWPCAESVWNAIRHLTADPTCRRWIWQGVSLTMFSLANMIGLPLLVATCCCLLHVSTRRNYGLVLFAGLAMTLLSIVLAAVITTPYDNYSVGGQLVLHTRWYLYFLGPVAMWLVYRYLRERARCPGWLSASALTAAALPVVCCAMPLSMWRHILSPPLPGVFTFSEEEWLALRFIHDHTPAESVVLTNRFFHNKFAMSGLTGRASYLEYTPNLIDNWQSWLNPDDNRQERIKDLWATTDPLLFSKRLGQTHATILLEHAELPLRVSRRSGLVRLWSSPHGQVTVWSIDSHVAFADARSRK
jgi:hypothetical protein